MKARLTGFVWRDQEQIRMNDRVQLITGLVASRADAIPEWSLSEVAVL
jgi:hypothetical protein